MPMSLTIWRTAPQGRVSHNHMRRQRSEGDGEKGRQCGNRRSHKIELQFLLCEVSKTQCEGSEEGEVVEGNAEQKTRAKCTVRQRDSNEREREREGEGVATGLQNEHSVIPKNFADIKFHLISFRFSQSPNFYLNKISCKFLSNS